MEIEKKKVYILPWVSWKISLQTDLILQNDEVSMTNSVDGKVMKWDMPFVKHVIKDKYECTDV